MTKAISRNFNNQNNSDNKQNEENTFEKHPRLELPDFYDI